MKSLNGCPELLTRLLLSIKYSKTVKILKTKAVQGISVEHGMESRVRKRESRNKRSAPCLEKEMEKNLKIGKLLNSSATATCACVSVCDTDVHRPKLIF